MFKSIQKEQLKVPGHQDYMPDLREFVTRIGRKYGLAEKLINSFKIAVDEAATNIIEHGYQDQQSHITIQAIVKRKNITIVLIDQGPFFDPNWADEPDLLVSAEAGDRPHLGIFLLRKLIDKIDYVKTDAGNELRLTKYRQAANRSPGLKSALLQLQTLSSAYFLPSLAIFTLLTISLFFYSYNKMQFKRVSDFLFAGQEISTRIANHLSSARADFLRSADGAIYLNSYLQPVYAEKVWQIHTISVVDSSGKMLWSTKSAEIQMPFKRPAGVTYIAEGIHTYLIEGVSVYEFEKPTSPKKKDFFSGKIRVLFLKNYLDRQIKIAEFRYLRNGLIVLGIGYIAIAFLVYIFIHLPRTIFKFKKNGDAPPHPAEIAGESDTLIPNIEIESERGIDREIPKIEQPKQSEGKRTDTETEDKHSDAGEHPALLDSINSVEENENDSAYNILQLPAPLQPAETAKEAESKPDPAKKTSPIAAVPEFTLVEFLDHLNSSAEAVKAAATHLSQSVKRKPAQKLNRQPKLEPISEKVKVQAKTPEPIAEIVEAIDENFEIEDISDSLVDAIFDDFVGAKIGTTEDDTSAKTPPGQRKEEVSESLVEAIEEGPKVRTEEEIATEESLESEDREKPQGEIKLLSAPAQKEPLQTEKEETPTETDIETEADSILVESIEDLFSKIKQVHNLTSKKDEPAREPQQAESRISEKLAGQPVKIELKDNVSEKIKTERADEPGVVDPESRLRPAEKAETFLRAGVKYYRKKQYEDAIIAFRNLLKIEPDSKNIYLLLGNAYFKNDMMNDALTVYEQYMKKYPGESIAHENMAQIYEKKSVYQLALKEWKSALDLNDDRPDIKGKIEKAEKLLNAQTQNGRSVKGTQTIGSKPPEAKVRQKKQDEQKNTLLKKGVNHYRNKDFAAAVSSFKVAIKVFPKFKEAYSFLGITYFRYKMFDESKQAFEKLKQLQFESESDYENMGLIYAKQGSYGQAVGEWKKVLKVSPHRTDIKEKIDKAVKLL